MSVEAFRAVRRYHTEGMAPIAIPYRSKNPNRKGWEKERWTADQLREQFNGDVPLNVGLITGAASGGLADADLDCPEAVEVAPVLMPPTRRIGGRERRPYSHRFYHVDGEFKTVKFLDPVRLALKQQQAMILELRWDDLQTVVYPSVHPDGDRYLWHQDGPPGKVSASDFRVAGIRTAIAALAARYWPGQGARHDAAMHWAGFLKGRGIPDDGVIAIVRAAATAAGDTEVADRVRAAVTTCARYNNHEEVTGGPSLVELLGEHGSRIINAVAKWTGHTITVRGQEISFHGFGREADNIEEEAADAGKGGDAGDDDAAGHNGDSETFHPTDYGNAERLVRHCGRDFRHCHVWNKDLVWDGRRWGVDDTATLERWMKSVVRGIYHEAGDTEDKKKRDVLVKHALRSEGEARIKAAISLARSEHGIPIRPPDLDADPYAFNVLNGTLNLRAGKLETHRREDLITKLAPVEFDAAATCPTWMAFLDRVFESNQDLISFIQRAVGYSLTGLTVEQVILLLYGLGANGKSTLLEVLRTLLGDYAAQADFSTFLARDHDPVRNDIARLMGTRFVAATEVEGGRRLSEVLIKQLTGGDMITARFLHREFFEFKPAFKIWLAANHRPEIRGTDHAIWRRIRLVPFNVQIAEADQDKHLVDKLRAELPGILNWALAGCLAWQREGLGIPKEVSDATASYRTDMDEIGSFIAERCVVHARALAPASELYAAYVKWSEANGEKPAPQRTFGMRLTERGFKREKVGHAGRIQWTGIGLRSDQQSPPGMGADDADKGGRPTRESGTNPLREGETNAERPHHPHGPQDFTDSIREDALVSAERRGWPADLPYANGRLTCAGESWWREVVADADDVVLNQLLVELDDVPEVA